MEFIKKFAKEISVFGLVIVIFLGLFIYRQATFKDYKTIKQDELTKMVENKEDFAVVLGDSTDNTMMNYQAVMTKYTTNNRSTPLYYMDTKGVDKMDTYIKETFNLEAAYPLTIVVKDGKVVDKKDGLLQYYSLYDFINETLK